MEDDQWEGFEELDKAGDKDAKRAPEVINLERDASSIKLKPKGRQINDFKDVVPTKAPDKALGNPFDALAKVDDDAGDANDEIDGKQVGVSIDDSAY